MILISACAALFVVSTLELSFHAMRMFRRSLGLVVLFLLVMIAGCWMLVPTMQLLGAVLAFLIAIVVRLAIVIITNIVLIVEWRVP